MSELRPITREDFYMHYLAYGGEIDLLPEPFTKKEEYLYKICLRINEMNNEGAGGSSINVIDDLLSESTTDALSANQGRVLNEKIPTKIVTDIKNDTLNGRLYTTFNNGEDFSLYYRKIPFLDTSLQSIKVTDAFGYWNNGIISYGTLNSKWTHIYNSFIYGVSFENGILELVSANGNIVIDINNYIESKINSTLGKTNLLNEENYIHYYKNNVLDGEKIEVTEDEYNNSECLIKHYKEVDGDLIEITEEEFLER